MKETLRPGLSGEPPEEPDGFFGAERARLTEEVRPEVWTEIDDYLARTRGGQERLIPLLHRVQRTQGHVPFAVQEYIADRLGLSPIQVYGVVSFYHFFTTTPRGRHDLEVCVGTACFVRRAQQLVETARQVLGVEPGGVTADGLFSLRRARCVGACALAPVMRLGDETVGGLTPKSLRELLSRLRCDPRGAQGPGSSGNSGD